MTIKFRETDVVTYIPAYRRRPHIYIGYRMTITLQDQVWNKVSVHFENSRQIDAFVRRFGDLLQRGQTVLFECVALGMRGYIRGGAPETRDVYGNRIMPKAGHPQLEALIAEFNVSERERMELAAWNAYTAHNQEWYQRQVQSRVRSYAREGMGA
jgi:hypothetical protein